MLAARALCLALALGASAAHADSPRDEAARHTRMGLQLYELQRYGEAEAELQAAYSLAPEPALLYDLARVRAALGRHAEAADTLERFIATGPPSHELARAQPMAIEERKLAAREAAPKKRFPYPATVALSASTVALAATAIATGVASQSSYDKLTHCSTCEGERSFGRRLQVVSLVTLVIGSATLVGDVIAIPYEHARARRESHR